MVQAVLFDCDGVLVDSEIVGLSDTAAFMRSKGFEWDEADLIRIFTGLRDDVFAAKMAEEYASLLGRPATEEEAAELFQGMVTCRRAKRDTMQAVPGAKEMVTQVEQLPFKTAVASSTRAIYLEDKLKRFDLWEHFAPHAYSAELVEAGKPAPDIFLYAAEQLKVEPSTCIVIEDSTHGVTAGLAAGMTVWGFTGGGHCFDGHTERLQDAGASCVIPSHAELAGSLQDLARNTMGA